MTTDDKRAFLCGLRDLLVRHGVKSIYAHYDGWIQVTCGDAKECFDLGTIEEIEKEIKDLK